MGFFSRITSAVRSVFSFRRAAQETTDRAAVEAEVDTFDDDLQTIWDGLGGAIADDSEMRAFTLDNSGSDLFATGWVADDVDDDERANAREEFFELMEAYDISRDEFDWDAWRDWYESE